MTKRQTLEIGKRFLLISAACWGLMIVTSFLPGLPDAVFLTLLSLGLAAWFTSGVVAVRLLFMPPDEDG